MDLVVSPAGLHCCCRVRHVLQVAAAQPDGVQVAATQRGPRGRWSDQLPEHLVPRVLGAAPQLQPDAQVGEEAVLGQGDAARVRAGGTGALRG